MCRWLAYTGNPIQLEAVLFRAQHSLIDQSLHSRFGQATTNGDGFGVGWYTHPTDAPFRYRCAHPAWSDRNLRDAAQAVRSLLFVAHVRAATDTPSQETIYRNFKSTGSCIPNMLKQLHPVWAGYVGWAYDTSRQPATTAQ